MDGHAGATSGSTGTPPAQEILRALSSFDETLRFLSDCLTEVSILHVDHAGRVRTWSAGAARMFGHAEQDALGTPLSRLFASDQRQRAEVLLRDAEKSTSGVRGTWMLVRRDGQVFAATGIATALRNESDGSDGFLLLVRESAGDREHGTRVREHEAWHRAIAELTSDYAVTCRVAEGGRVIIEAVTDGFAKVTGYTREELDDAGGWPILLHPSDLPTVERSIGCLLAGQQQTSEVRIRRKDGQVRWVRYLARPVTDRSGTVTHIYSAAQDITALKQNEQKLKERERLALFGRDVGLALAEADSLPTMLRRCTDAMVEHLHAAFARIWTVNDAEQVLELQASSGLYTHLHGPHSRVPIGEFKIGLIAAEGKPHLTNAVIGDARVHDQEWARRESMVAFAGYPLVVNGRVVGVMALFAREPLSPAAIDGMASVARGIAVGIERKRVELEAVRQREWLRTTLASIGDGVIATDAQGRVVFLNPVAESWTGWSNGEAVGRPMRDVFPIVNERTRQPVEDPVARVLRENRVVGLANHTVLRTRDGKERPIDDSAAPIRDEHGDLLGCVLVFRDVTERRAAERERATLVQQLEAERTRFEAVLQQLPAGVVVAEAPSGKLVLANDRVRQILGHEFLASAAIEEYGQYHGFHLDGRPYLPDEWPLARSVLRGEVVTGEEIGYRRGDGTEIVLRVNSGPVRDATGRIIAAVVTFYDVTAERAAEEVLFRREQEFKALAENAPDIIARFDRQFRHVYVNPAVQRAASVNAAAFLGKTNRELGMPAELCAQWEDAYQRVFETGQETILEFTYPTPGEPRHFQSRIVPEFDRDGRVATILGVTRDITDRKRLEADLREHVTRLADADQRKDQFLAMLAHELRNPLASMFNALGVLKQPGLDEQVRARVRDVLERQTINLTRLVDDLLDVSRITTGKIQLRMEPTNLEGVIRRALEAARPLIEVHRHRVTLSLPPGPTLLLADSTRLEQVLTNLINNAAKYTEPEGHITITGERETEQIVLRVKDTGIGIAPDLLPRVFDLFVQADHARDRAHGGLGLGLTLVRTLVEMHGGTVVAHSGGAGTGAEFTIRLPLGLREAPTTAAEAVSSARSPRRRVLVVDDNMDAGESLAMMLELLGHEVRVAHDGPSALAVAAEYRPEVVFLDIGLPGMSGYEVARRFRELPMLPSPVLAALTGWGQEQDRRRSKDAGFDYHLVKPAEADALEQVLKAYSSGL